MKDAKWYIRYLGQLVFIAFGLIGCTASPIVPRPTSPISTNAPEVTATMLTRVSATLSIVDSASKTLEPMVTSPTPKREATPHSTPYLIPTLAPTMTGDQERKFIVDMLNNNMNCALPCWWGITPGVTEWVTTQDSLASYGKAWGDYQYSSDEIEHGTSNFEMWRGDTLLYYIDPTFYEEEGLIQSIKVSSECLVPACNTFLEDWRPYSYHQIVQKYGKPSHVFIQFVPPMEMGATAYYELRLVYETLGFYVHYLGTAIVNPPIIKFYASFDEVTTIRLFLQSPQAETSIVELLGDTPQLEEVTELTIDDFYNALKNPSENLCIESTLGMWP